MEEGCIGVVGGGDLMEVEKLAKPIVLASINQSQNLNLQDGTMPPPPSPKNTSKVAKTVATDIEVANLDDKRKEKENLITSIFEMITNNPNIMWIFQKVFLKLMFEGKQLDRKTLDGINDAMLYHNRQFWINMKKKKCASPPETNLCAKNCILHHQIPINYVKGLLGLQVAFKKHIYDEIGNDVLTVVEKLLSTNASVKERGMYKSNVDFVFLYDAANNVAQMLVKNHKKCEANCRKCLETMEKAWIGAGKLEVSLEAEHYAHHDFVAYNLRSASTPPNVKHCVGNDGEDDDDDEQEMKDATYVPNQNIDEEVVSEDSGLDDDEEDEEDEEESDF